MFGETREDRLSLTCPRTALGAALIGAALVALFPLSSPALEGALSGTLPAGTYTITDDIWVSAGQTLTLSPGVVFEFEDGFWEEYEFDVDGTLLAPGTAASPIIFRAASGVPEYNYIRIASSASILRHCVIRDVGSVSLASQGGLWIDGCSPLVEDCEVVSASWHGVYVTGSSALPVIRRTVSHDNGNDGFDADQGAGMYLENCTSYGNGEDGICLSSGSNTIVGCLVYGNGQDGIDCRGVTSYDAAIVNCTVGPHPGEGLSDDSAFRLYNTLVVDANDGGALAEHSLVVDDLAFFAFVNPGAGDYRLSGSSPAVNYGTCFGVPGAVLPAHDSDGNVRIQGIVDAGAIETSSAVNPGTSGPWFSENLIAPRMGQPVLRENGESFEAVIGLMGSYAPGQVQARLVDPDGSTLPLAVSGIVSRDLAPGTEEEMRIDSRGLEMVLEITLSIPAETPDGFYGIEIDIVGLRYRSVSAVRVYDEYPSSWGFIHVTDLHVGYDQEAYSAAERLEFFVREANFLDPELVVVTGDVCEDQNLGHDWPQQFLEKIAALHVPLYVLPGNHDHYNDGQGCNAAGWFRYFREINRCRNSRLELGGARFYGLNSGYDHGLTNLYRCDGPSGAALDWVEADAAALAPSEKPRFLLMHGPNYDYFSWNMSNTSRVRDILDDYGFALGAAGHTHRFETFLNAGENVFGRNDFGHEDDWVRDVPFPGYPLHVQTSSLGKEEHLAARVAREVEAMEMADAESVAAAMGFANVGTLHSALRVEEGSEHRGLFGDDIGWRWVQIDGTEAAFFTADTDGDGYRNTEDPWLLGEIRFALANEPDGSIVSSVENLHHETWRDVRHYVPADAGTEYVVEGGTLARRLPDGTAVVSVESVGPVSTSVVTLAPATGVGNAGAPRVARLLPAAPNPFNPRTTLAFDLPRAGAARLEIYAVDGRLVTTLVDGPLPAGRHIAVWDGRDDSGNDVASGVYFARLRAGGTESRARLVLLR